MSISPVPQPIESYGMHHHGHHTTMPQLNIPQPMDYTYSNTTSECPCESCNYYRQSSMYSLPSTPTTPVTPTTPFSPYSHNPYNNVSFGNSNVSFGNYPSYDAQCGPMQSNSMPLQQIPQNMMYSNYNQMPQQSNGMCYPDPSSMMSCYPSASSYQQQQHMMSSQPTTPVSTMSMPIDPEAINHPVAYSLTEQFRHIVGSVVATACTPRGRSLLQSVMRLQHSDKVQTIFDEIVAEAPAVMLDPNGCHVVRSLIEMLDEEQVRKLVASMNETTILNVATTSQYTRRILQVLFERHKPENLSAIVDVLSIHALSLATTQQGCIALMRVIERCSSEQKEKLLVSLMPSLLDLATDPFGNYVVQSVLEHYKHESVTAALKGHLMKLATNKFASNVMEKAFRFSAPNVRAELIDELFEDEGLGLLVQDGFGNFVIQSVIDSCPTQVEFRRISDKLRPLLQASPYGHKIETKLRNKKFNANGQSIAPSKSSYSNNKENSENMSPL